MTCAQVTFQRKVKGFAFEESYKFAEGKGDKTLETAATMTDLLEILLTYSIGIWGIAAGTKAEVN